MGSHEQNLPRYLGHLCAIFYLPGYISSVNGSDEYLRNFSVLLYDLEATIASILNHLGSLLTAAGFVLNPHT